MLDDNIAFALMAQILSPAFRSACRAALLAKSSARGCACFSCCKGLERIEHESKAPSAFGTNVNKHFYGHLWAYSWACKCAGGTYSLALHDADSSLKHQDSGWRPPMAVVLPYLLPYASYHESSRFAGRVVDCLQRHALLAENEK